jgi:hypothetical protein
MIFVNDRKAGAVAYFKEPAQQCPSETDGDVTVCTVRYGDTVAPL